MESTYGTGVPKVAIPRQSRTEPRDSTRERKDESQRAPRIGRACLKCRSRKVKCSGDTPRCSNCAANDLDCVYEQARRDRLKSATSKNRDLVSLLRELSLRQSLDESDKARIQDVLDGYEEETGSAVSVKSLKRRKFSASDEGDKDDDEHQSTALRARVSYDSDDGSALLDEDLLRSRKTRSTGYVGQGSGVHWLRSLQDDSNTETPNQQSISDPNDAIPATEHSSATKPGPPGSVTEASFYLDADSADLDVEVDPYGLPPIEIAEKLLDCYMQTVHKSFPILSPQFEDQFRRYFKSVKSERPFQVPDKWLAMLNLVFAIGAQYSHLIGAEWQGESRDHVVYMTRTIRLLGPWPFATTPDLALIQVSGLLAFYYQVIGHVSRGWVLIGIAIRLALALGLHLRNEDPKLPLSKKETILRTWWSLHAIECQLSGITGRPCVLGHEDCTVALPVTLANDTSTSTSRAGSTPSTQAQEKSPTSASGSASEKSRKPQAPRSYLDAHLSLGLITQKALSALYSPRIAHYPWSYVQNTIPKLLRELNEWKQEALPDEGRLSTLNRRERLLLRFYYSSTKILITRPCLCRSGRKTKDQSDALAQSDQQVAETCVETAIDLAELLCVDPSPHRMYEIGPWWSIVHNIMQAMAVLLLELSYEQNHVQGIHTTIKDSVKKMVHWLNATRQTDVVVERAHKIITKILEQKRFQAIFGELMIGDDVAHGHNQPAPDFVHSHPQASAYNTDIGMPSSPQGQWYGGNYASNTQPESGHFNPAAADAQLLADLGHTQVPQQAISQMSHLPSPSEQYQYLEIPYSNRLMFSNPFTTSYDQDTPFGFPFDSMWPGVGTFGNEGFTQQDGAGSSSYPFPTNSDPQDRLRQPQ